MISDLTHRIAQREQLLIPREVATLFRVDVRTVTGWAATGRLDSTRTPGGRYRFAPDVVARALATFDAGAVSA